MTSSRSVSPASLPTVRNSIIPEFLSVTSTNLPSDNLYNISYQLKRMRDEQHSLTLIEQQKTSKMTGLLPKNSILLMNTPQQQSTIINTPTHELQKISHFHLNRSKNNEKKLDVHQSNKKFLKSENRFNNTAYCVAYCTVIIIGVTTGGWIGGLFELISGGHDGCTNEHRGNFKCQIKYASFNVTTHCINIFYKKSIPNNSPYICLCRFRNNSKSKYRDCEFLHAKIQ